MIDSNNPMMDGDLFILELSADSKWFINGKIDITLIVKVYDQYSVVDDDFIGEYDRVPAMSEGADTVTLNYDANNHIL